MNFQIIDECTRVLASRDVLWRCGSIEPRRNEQQRADLMLRFADRAWLRSSEGADLIEAFRSHPATSTVERQRSALLLRFDDATLTGLEQLLAAGEPAGMDTMDALAGQTFAVSFVGPNTNKALHVGHLRNVLLGQALVSALEAAGARVQRRSLVGDIGRRACEAMGGYLTEYPGEDPTASGLAEDRFVEDCSRAYARHHADPAARQRPSSPQETEVPGDLADDIMKSWCSGARPTRGLWERMRGWTLAGHERTLARLGVHIDAYDFESDGIARAQELIAMGLEQGCFEREESGAVLRRTGRPEYATMVVLNQDGAPTECGRLVGTIDKLLSGLDPDISYVEVVGDEWHPAQSAIDDVLMLLSDGVRSSNWERVWYGLVTVEGKKMGSSTGQVFWIDDMLDELAAGPSVSELYERAEGVVSRDVLADTIVRGAFLSAPVARPLEFNFERLLQRRAGPGWTMAEAWCHVCHPASAVAAASTARAGVVLSQHYEAALLKAVSERDPSILAAYLVRLSEAFIAAPQPGAAAMPILRRVLGSLGFLAGRPSHDRQEVPCSS
jgi:arginyl-tRNA synthetase